MSTTNVANYKCRTCDTIYPIDLTAKGIFVHQPPNLTLNGPPHKGGCTGKKWVKVP